jgi:hypothetical protein
VNLRLLPDTDAPLGRRLSLCFAHVGPQRWRACPQCARSQSRATNAGDGAEISRHGSTRLSIVVEFSTQAGRPHTAAPTPSKRPASAPAIATECAAIGLIFLATSSRRRRPRPRDGRARARGRAQGVGRALATRALIQPRVFSARNTRDQSCHVTRTDANSSTTALAPVSVPHKSLPHRHA